MPFSYNVTVYRRNLQAEFQVGGQGYRWLDKVKLAMHTAAVADAASFTRSGDILRGHRSHIRGINQWACMAEIENVSEHSEWKHEGTIGPITATDSPYMLVPVSIGASRRFRAKSVRGQIGDPWLDRACTAVAIGYGAVPYG